MKSPPDGRFERLSDLPLVSVVVPAYNASRWIERTLKSVAAQTYPNLEIIVVDDGSSDDTAAVVQAFACQEPRLRLVRKTNGGVASARNRGIAEARGRYVAPIDADDIWLPENLECQVAALESAGETAPFSFASSFLIDEHDRIKGTPPPRLCPPDEQNPPRHVGPKRPRRAGDYRALLRRNWIANGSAAVFRRDAVLAVGGFDETLRAQNAQGGEDWKLALTLAARAPGVVVKDELIGYRLRADSMSADPEPMTKSVLMVIEEMRQTGPKVAPWYYWHARTTVLVHMFPRWIRAGQWRGAIKCLAYAYLANPLWFTEPEARRLFSRAFKQLFT